MSEKYKDIINLPRHKSKTRKPMDLINRAAQFAPFAALTGFEEEISEAGRLTEEKIDLDENEKEEINRRLVEIMENIEARPKISLIYYKEDGKKSGGHYIKVQGRLVNISRADRLLIMEDGERINIGDIVKINSQG